MSSFVLVVGPRNVGKGTIVRGARVALRGNDAFRFLHTPDGLFHWGPQGGIHRPRRIVVVVATPATVSRLRALYPTVTVVAITATDAVLAARHGDGAWRQTASGVELAFDGLPADHVIDNGGRPEKAIREFVGILKRLAAHEELAFAAPLAAPSPAA